MRPFEKILTRFLIHPLIIEDILNIRTRAKIEEFDEYLSIVMSNFHRSIEGMNEEQVSMILTEKVKKKPLLVKVHEVRFRIPESPHEFVCLRFLLVR